MVQRGKWCFRRFIFLHLKGNFPPWSWTKRVTQHLKLWGWLKDEVFLQDLAARALKINSEVIPEKKWFSKRSFPCRFRSLKTWRGVILVKVQKFCIHVWWWRISKPSTVSLNIEGSYISYHLFQLEPGQISKHLQWTKSWFSQNKSIFTNSII